jgi:hypothetical protein
MNFFKSKPTFLVFLFSFLGFIEVDGQTIYYLTTSGGDFNSEKCTSIRSGLDRIVTQFWGKIEVTYSKGSRLLAEKSID